MKINTFADAVKTNPKQTQSNPILSAIAPVLRSLGEVGLRRRIQTEHLCLPATPFGGLLCGASSLRRTGLQFTICGFRFYLMRSASFLQDGCFFLAKLLLVCKIEEHRGWVFFLPLSSSVAQPCFFYAQRAVFWLDCVKTPRSHFFRRVRKKKATGVYEKDNSLFLL